MPRRSLTEQDDTPEINLSPMIDCIFILLIFFIVTTVFVEESGLEVNKPEPGGSQSLDSDETIEIVISADNKITFNGHEIGVEGVQARLKQTVNQASEQPVLILAHESSDHGTFATVWGEARAAGIQQLTFNIRN
jgi:biopolymer transport protein ExbD